MTLVRGSSLVLYIHHLYMLDPIIKSLYTTSLPKIKRTASKLLRHVIGFVSSDGSPFCSLGDFVSPRNLLCILLWFYNQEQMHPPFNADTRKHFERVGENIATILRFIAVMIVRVARMIHVTLVRFPRSLEVG